MSLGGGREGEMGNGEVGGVAAFVSRTDAGGRADRRCGYVGV